VTIRSSLPRFFSKSIGFNERIESKRNKTIQFSLADSIDLEESASEQREITR
jgi:hypothetical protein